MVFANIEVTCWCICFYTSSLCFFDNCIFLGDHPGGQRERVLGQDPDGQQPCGWAIKGLLGVDREVRVGIRRGQDPDVDPKAGVSVDQRKHCK